MGRRPEPRDRSRFVVIGWSRSSKLLMQVNFAILRQQQGGTPAVRDYLLEVSPEQTILDCLDRIKWELDGSLAFRKNCRNTICGSCGMRVNGRSALACKEKVGGVLARQPDSVSEPVASVPTIRIAPLGNLPVIRDLVVDMQPFWDDLSRVDPYVSTRARAVPEREFLQSPEERSDLEATGNCIMCGACYSECNAKEVNPAFVGPHALAKARRMTADKRDAETEARLDAYGEDLQGVWGCTRCYLCNEVCPMEVAPLDRISELKQDVLARHRNEAASHASRPVRHRKVLVDLVARGGWLDERKFGIRVVGNHFRDWPGLLSLAPLGMRMLASGKFPLLFEPSEGTQEVRGLIARARASSEEAESVPKAE